MCVNLGTFTVGNASPTGLCSGPFTLTLYGNSLSIGQMLYTNPGC